MSPAEPCTGARFVELPPPADFAESTIPGLLVAELDSYPDDVIDLAREIREAEEQAS